MPIFPQEIIDIVIDELDSTGGKKSLSTVALVSRSLLPRAQFHLFRSVDVSLSPCRYEDANDWATFHTFLTKSRSIKSYVREVFMENIDDTYDSHFGSSWSCPDESHRDHRMTKAITQRLSTRKMECVSSVLQLLPRLEAIRLNYGTQPRTTWPHILGDVGVGGRNVLTRFGFEQSMRSLILCSVKGVPITVMDSILGLSQLTTLVFDNIVLEGEVPIPSWPQKSCLTNLHTVGFVYMTCSYASSRHNLSRLVNLIISTASHTIRKLIWSTRSEDPPAIQSLHNLQVFSTVTRRPYYLATAQPILEQIIASQQKMHPLKTLEFFGMESYHGSILYGADIVKARRAWKGFDDLLEDEAFSKVKEVRLLFSDFTGSNLGRVITRSNTMPAAYELYTTKEVMSGFKASLSKATRRGVVFTSGLTYGRDGLVSRY
ncbi:hypothetical protein CPB84DRAFT_1964110 [Gymnopilus junonius]|uniref:Uncharacterized protein n=1 Tax=Gymnopilus junonius TaxID=109634 RepID=A0A9P5NKJ1_GYMJU|nr:hypothetical protein CPB84DRAFT_1964110 [Gymnopilus junonius]